MKILIVSFYFPPYNAIGSVRVGKTAKYLQRLGHEVKVLTAKEVPLPESLRLEIPESQVFRTDWINVNGPAMVALGGRKTVAQQGYAVRPTRLGQLVRWAGKWYKNLTNIPDGQIGWIPYALRQGNQVIRDWKPDIIYASALPFSSLVIAKKLSCRHQIPWVAEMRDLWLDNHFSPVPVWRRSFETWMESRVLNSATALVTVSEPLARLLRQKFAKNTAVVTNGYDTDDLVIRADFKGSTASRGQLLVRYTGMVYEGKQDLESFLQALQQIPAEIICVEFYGRYLQTVVAQAERFSVADRIRVFSPVSYEESLQLQQEADILLLLLSKNSQDEGVYTGKFFEYIGAQRPILAVGKAQCEPAMIIEDNHLGKSSENPTDIAEWLQELWVQKKNGLRIPSVGSKQLARFSRQYQTEILADFLENIHNKPARPIKLCTLTTVATTVRIFLIDQLPYLAECGFVITVVCSPDDRLLASLPQKLTFKPIEMERNADIGSTVRNIISLVRLFRRERFDMIQYATPKAALVSSIAGVLAGVPVRLYCQWGIRYVGFSGWKRRLFKSLEWLTCRLSTHISPDSRGNLDFSVCEGLYSENKASVVHFGSANGVDLVKYNLAARDLFRAETRAKLEIGTEVVFGWVGRITRDKGVYELVEAYRQLAESGFPGVLVIIGECEENPELPESILATLRQHPGIRCLGEIEDLPRYYAAMDVLVLPSYREGFGAVAIEGQAMGLPVVTTDIPGPRESIVDGKTGLLVPPRSVEPLRVAMEKLGRDAEMRSVMGAAGVQYVTERFEQQEFWQKMLEHRLWLLGR